MNIVDGTRGASIAHAASEPGGLHRTIDWKGAFWIASGVPALVLISIGFVATGFARYEPDPQRSPAAAVQALKKIAPTHVLNEYDFGGYLIASGIAPFIDGRTELYGSA
ncbi:MAG: hypothetical protein J0I81_01520, partial [Hyphomicrobium sp.]|nr:hypothetical protein [Hyphomicrobium sp.]